MFDFITMFASHQLNITFCNSSLTYLLIHYHQEYSPEMKDRVEFSRQEPVGTDFDDLPILIDQNDNN